MNFDLTGALEAFTDEEGNNPLNTGTSLLTFGKTIPFQIFKGILIALLLYVLLLGLIVYLSAPTWLIILATIIGFCSMLAMAFTTTLKFITDAFFENVNEFINSLFHPIDKVYEDFRNDERDPNMSKAAFFGKILDEVITPKVNGMIDKVPYGSKISARLDILVEDIKSSEHFAATSDEAPATDFSQPINDAVLLSAEKANAPFRFTLKWVLISWAVIFLAWVLSTL